MKVIRATRSVFFDVDDTLVIWDWKKLNPDGVGLIQVGTELVMPHQRHIELMKQFKARKHTVVVWSQGGHEWAEAVCKALGIEDVVDFVMDKPNWYVDDLHATAWMRAPIYLHPFDPRRDQRWGVPEENDILKQELKEEGDDNG
jgi:phosphoserine phosphatase